MVDFSRPRATLRLAPIAAAAGVAIVSGTTGLDDDARAALESAAKRVAVLWEPNMSVGVHALSQLVEQAVAALSDWDIEIVEVHHRAKVDAPSGTALRLAEVARAHGPVPRASSTADTAPRVHARPKRLGSTRCAAATSSAITSFTCSAAESGSSSPTERRGGTSSRTARCGPRAGLRGHPRVATR